MQGGRTKFLENVFTVITKSLKINSVEGCLPIDFTRIIFEDILFQGKGEKGMGGFINLLQRVTTILIKQEKV